MQEILKPEITSKFLELRVYGLVPIQQNYGTLFAHARLKENKEEL